MVTLLSFSKYIDKFYEVCLYSLALQTNFTIKLNKIINSSKNKTYKLILIFFLYLCFPLIEVVENWVINDPHQYIFHWFDLNSVSLRPESNILYSNNDWVLRNGKKDRCSELLKQISESNTFENIIILKFDDLLEVYLAKIFGLRTFHY